MPWRLIGFILALALITVFIGFNLDNACDLSFGFLRIAKVPVYLTVFASFVAGMIAVLPFTFAHAARRRKAAKAARSGRSAHSAGPSGRGGRRGGSSSSEAELDDGAYGVD
jgi:uncharacterized integral membrane protein